MKKILCLLLVLSILISSSTIIMADSPYKTEHKYAELFLEKLGHPNNVNNPKPLYNKNDSIECICFDIVNGGYIIVNANDLSVPELSFTNNSPFMDNKQYIYNGPLSYIEKNKISFIDYTNIEYIYNKTKVNKEEKIKNLNNANTGYRSIVIEKYLSKNLNTWYKDGGYCGSIAAAICLMFYDSVYNASYVATDNESESTLIDLLIPYIDGSEPGSNTSDLTSGINSYLNAERSMSQTAYSSSNFSFSTVKSKIGSNKPVIIDTDNHPTYGEHWIIAHGYYEFTGIDQYIIVNDGWESNNVWINIDSYLDDMVFIN